MEYTEIVKQLLTLGELQDTAIDYTALGLNAGQVEELKQMAIDPDLLSADEDDPKFWAIIHAWYALGQLQITEVIPTLLDLNDQYEYDYLFDDEFPKVFALMGLPAISILKEYLDNPTKSQPAHFNAVTCLEKIGAIHRTECVAVLTDFITNASVEQKDLAGMVVCALLELKAIESIEIMRDAFKRRCVNIGIPGDIEDVEIDLGLRLARSTPKPDYHADMPEIKRLRSLLNLEEYQPENDAEIPAVRSAPKTGRNDPCPCGSGKKYKKCCLQ